MEKDIFYLTKYLLSYICDEFHEKDLRNGINSYYSMSCGLILNMNKNNEKVIQKDLQDELLTPKSVTSELVSKMINDGLIYKEKDELDKYYEYAKEAYEIGKKMRQAYNDGDYSKGEELIKKFEEAMKEGKTYDELKVSKTNNKQKYPYYTKA